MINSLVYQVKSIKAAVDNSRSALGWPVTQKAERAQEASFEFQLKLLQANQSVGKYTVPFSTTLAGVAQATGAKVGDLMSLNPHLVNNPEVPAGTLVRHFVVP
jgi:hypothetical protein